MKNHTRGNFRAMLKNIYIHGELLGIMEAMHGFKSKQAKKEKRLGDKKIAQIVKEYFS